METYEIKHVFVTSNNVPGITNTSEYTVYLPNFIKDIVRVEVLSATYWTPKVSAGTYLDIEELRNPVAVLTASGTASLQSVSSSAFAVLPGGQVTGYSNYNSGTNYPFVVNYPYPLQKLDRLTVRWTDVNGTLMSMGTKDNSFLLKVYTLRQNLGPVIRPLAARP
jgi:hypothetical protein